MTWRVRFTEEAKRDLEQLYGFLLEGELVAATNALESIEQALTLLEKFPFSCRKVAEGRHGPFLREFVVPFGSAGYVVLFEIDGRDTVTILAARHQRESDYH